MPYIGRGSEGFGIRERYQYTATSNQTAFTGSDLNSKTLAFDNGSLVDVLLNGVVLKPTTDYNTSTANTVTLVSGASTSDEVMIIVYDVFALSDAMPKTGGTFSGGITGTTGTFSGAIIGDDLASVKSTGGDVNLTTNAQAGSSGSPLNMDINFKGYSNNVMAMIRSHDESSSTGHGELQFHITKHSVGTREALNIDHDGDVKVSLGDIVFGTAGKGINLGVTSNTDSNTLDDYEEGTFTFTTNANIGLNSSSNVGNYTKIGRIVHVQLMMDLSSVSGTNHVYVGGMPFTSIAHTSSTYNGNAFGSISLYNVDFDDDANFTYAVLGNSSTTVYFYHSKDNGNWDVMVNSELTSSAEIGLSITYTT